jgi:hypothetical protein
MRYSAALNLTTYIISHKEGDSSIRVLSSILDTTIETARPPQRTFLRDPFDIAVILSTLSFEASKFHAARFRRFMWEQINKVDDHLAGLSDSDRRNLSNLTKQLQIISQNADSHLGNADVAIITASAIRTVHGHLHKAIGSPIQIHERAADSINYVIESVQKQKIWFLNYKARKDSTMALVYNLVTQQDAASNIQIAASMKRDSTSMNAIAALTMVFLPGTFTAVRLPTLLSFFLAFFRLCVSGTVLIVLLRQTLLDTGIFFARESSLRIHVSGLWWLWIVLTVPLTLIVIVCWWIYKKRKGKARIGPNVNANDDKGENKASQEDIVPPTPKRPSFRLANFRTWSRNDSIAVRV